MGPARRPDLLETGRPPGPRKGDWQMAVTRRIRGALAHVAGAFGLPRTTLTTLYPCGAPTFSPAMHSIWVNWAFETSLDLQWAHAMAPDANIVLIAGKPAETQGVQGLPCLFDGIEEATQQYP